MKKSFTILVFLLITFTISAQNKPQQSPVNPEFKKFIENKSHESKKITADGKALGLIPSPVKPVLRSPENTKSRSFPTSYDMRDGSNLSSVKNQGSCGSCWTFATYGSMESYWLMQGLGSYDFSEDNLNNCHPFDWAPCEGGSLYISAAMLSAGNGPMVEADDPYSGSSDNTCPTGLTPAAYVTDVWWADTSQNAIKQAITDYGALYVSMYWYDNAYNSSDYTYFYTGEGDGSDGGGGHGVTVVGWDDNKATNADKDGAWIVKNSWGSSWGESGYFYISYYDSIAFSSVGFLPGKIDYNADAIIHDYDECGWTNGYGWGDDGTDVGLVKYTASTDQQIEKIGTYAVASNSTIDITIYDDFDGSTFSNKLGELLNQSCAYAGYHTFELSSAIKISSGNDFYVKVSYNTGSNYPIPVEKQLSGYSSGTTIETSGKCYVSTDGGTWYQLGNDVSGQEYDLCIKAYATPTSGGGSDPSDSSPMSWVHPKPQGNTIYAGHFLNESLGFVCGAAGTVMKTTDGGTSWSIMDADTLTSLYGIHFLTEDTGFVGGYGFIKRTVDGGATWSYMEENEYDPINDITFIDDTTGIAAVNYGTILRTVDKGKTWESVSVSTSSSLYDVMFTTSAKGFAVGTSGAILSTTDSGKTWTESTYGTKTLNAVYFIDETNGYVVGDDGTVYKTTDGGSNWTLMNSGINQYADLEALHFTDANTGIILGYGYIYKTTDGGSTWSEKFSEYGYDQRLVAKTGTSSYITMGGSPSFILESTDGGETWTFPYGDAYEDIKGIDFYNSTGYAVMDGDSVLKTTDGGSTWTQLPFSYYLDDILVIDGNTAIAVGSGGSAFKTTDGGQNWQDNGIGGSDGVYEIEKASSTTFYAVGNDTLVMKTTNSGDSWTKLSIPASAGYNLYGVDFINENIGLVVGGNSSGAHIFKTVDGGAQWTEISSPFQGYLYSIDFANDSVAYLAGEDGTMLKSMDTGSTWVQQTVTLPDGYTSNDISDVEMFDEQTGIAAGSFGLVYKTTDGGDTWNVVKNITRNFLTDITLVNGDAFISGWYGTILDYPVGYVAPLTADFTADATTGYAPLTINFTDQSTGSINSWSWDFNNDGTVDATTQNPSYEYTSAGTYSVSLTVSDGTNSDTKTETSYITVNEPVVADFTASATSGEAPLSVNFTDQSTGSINSWSWDFNNDGTVDATTQNPSYEYTSAGTYTVSLTVSDGTSSDTKTKTDLVTVSSASDCSWDFASSPYKMSFEVSDDLSDWITIDANNDDTTWGIYASEGVDGSRCAGYSWAEMSQADDWIISRCFDLESSKEYQISFYYKVAGANYPEKLALYYGNDATASAMSNLIVDLGQITNESYQESSNKFTVSSTGTYHFGWYAYSDANMWNVYIDSVTIEEVAEEPLAAGFKANTTSGDVPLTVDFTDQSTGNVSSWSWDFDGDGTEDVTTQNPSYEFTSAGKYTVSLTVSDGTNSETETKTDYITVNEPVDADFTSNVTSGEAPLTVNFTDQSTGTVSSWSWDFDGDGTEDATAQNPSYEYTEAGTYSVSLTVSNGSGSDTETKSSFVTVTKAFTCDWDFTASDYTMDFENSDDFTNWKYFDLNGDSYSWEVFSGDGINGSNCIRYNYSEVNDANDWVLSRCFELETGKYYKVEYQYAVAAQTMPEKLLFAMGPGQNPSSMVTTIVDHGEISNEDFVKSENVVSVSSDGTYYFGWKAYSNADNWNILVDGFKVSLTSAPTAIDQLITEELVTVYPNPSGGEYEVHVHESSRVKSLEVWTIDGSKVLKISGQNAVSDKVNLDLKDQPDGIYFLKIRGENNVITKKLIKQ